MDPGEEERDNFFRMTLLLFRVGNQKLREFFKTQWPIVYQNKTGTPPIAPWTDIPNDAIEMDKLDPDLLKKAIRFNDQKASFNSGDTNKWDFSLLTNVLKNSALGFVTSSSPESHAIKDFKDIRDKLIGHATDARISNMLYNTEWPKACHALKNVFSATQDEIDQVEEDVNKPVDVLIPVLKECLAREDEILNAIHELEKSNEIRHRETITVVKEGNEEIKETMNIGFQQVKDGIKQLAESKVHVCRMEKTSLESTEDQKLQLYVEERLKCIQKNVIASELFDFLPCLPDEKREAITRLEATEQPIQAVRELILFLIQRKGIAGLQILVTALSKAGYDQVAMVFDRDFEDHVSNEDAPENSDKKMYTVIAGTVVDVFLTLRFMDEQRQRLLDLEKKISVQFSEQHLQHTKKLRSNLTKILPKGVCFVETKNLEEMQATSKATNKAIENMDDSVVIVVRVAKAKALKELWKNRGSLKEELKRLLIENVNVLEGAEGCTVEMVFEESDYMSAMTDLDAIESQNASDSMDTASGALESKDHFVCKENIPPVHLVDDEPSSDSHEIVLREYQKELAAPAFEGKNVIICAPTNSGKTFVAVEIANRHLNAHRNTAGKVIFVVEKQNLILQQRLRFQKFLRHRVSDICSYNSSKTSLEQLLKSSDVVVLTADILVNALEEKRVKMTDLSLLLFDECHHTDKKHPFRKIMKFYLCEKFQENPQLNQLPQVVGFTASLGVGQAKNLDGAVDHVLQVCANHDALIVQSVQREIDDLNMFVTSGVPKSIVEKINDDFPNVFEKKVNEAMNKIEDFMGVNKAYSERHLEGYRQWIEQMEDYFQLEGGNRENTVYIKHLRSYHEALLLNYTATIDDAMKLLREFHDGLGDASFTSSTCWLKELPLDIEKAVAEHVRQSGKPLNPLLEALKKKIIEFHGNFEESRKTRGIVFTRTRRYTVALTKWIKETLDFKHFSLKPEVLVGSGDEEVGLTLPQQRAVIEKFKTGHVNIIFATSVAHEGLDIADCNYVISYDMLDSDISFVQSRGRIRADDGIYVRIVGSRSRSAENEQKVARNEQMMKEALVKVQSLELAEIVSKVREFQTEYVKSIREEQRQDLAKVGAAVGVRFYCGDCDAFAFFGEDVRRYKQNHLVVNPDIFQKILIKDKDKEQSKGPSRFKQKVHCSRCEKDWGVVLLTGETRWPCVKIGSFIYIIEGETERYKKDKWSKAHFKYEESSSEELHSARQALSQQSK